MKGCFDKTVVRPVLMYGAVSIGQQRNRQNLECLWLRCACQEGWVNLQGYNECMGENLQKL